MLVLLLPGVAARCVIPPREERPEQGGIRSSSGSSGACPAAGSSTAAAPPPAGCARNHCSCIRLLFRVASPVRRVGRVDFWVRWVVFAQLFLQGSGSRSNGAEHAVIGGATGGATAAGGAGGGTSESVAANTPPDARKLKEAPPLDTTRAL